MVDFVKSVTLDFWNTIAEMSPYLLFGFFVAGVLSIFISQSFVERHLGGKGIWPLIKASLFGVPLPLCSCGVIPVSMSLYKHGASKGSVISFLLSTPQTGVDSIFVTFSLLGPVFTVFRPLAAFVTGIIGGLFVNVLERTEENHNDQPPKCSDECCAQVGNEHKFVRGLKYGFITLPRDIGKAMLIGLVVAAVISAVVPDGYFADKLGTGLFAMVVMMLLGIPVYVCATASVPVAAALILKGLTPGAALVFLMTGPATNAASFITIWKTLGTKTAVAYILTVAGCALAGGILLDHIIVGFNFEIITRSGWMLPSAIKYASAIVLIIILAVGAISKKKE